MNKPQGRFFKCTECDLVHIYNKDVEDERQNCKKCNGESFIPVSRGIAGYMPDYCDHRKDRRIWDGVMSVFLGPIYTWAKEIEKKHKITFSKGDIQDLATPLAVLGKAMINTTRSRFDNDNMIKALKGKYRSYLYSKKKKYIKKRNQK